jgi:biotin transport system substrate-specific component
VRSYIVTSASQHEVDDLQPTPAREVAYAALFAALIAASAFVAIPLGPVPFTLQVLVVLLAGLVLGPRSGALAVGAYLVLGLVAPVYAGGASGVGVLFGPTGGYLWGFVLAAVTSGVVARRSGPGFAGLTVAALAGLVPIYVLGTAWLALQLHLSAEAAVAAGALPFLAADLVKAGAAALVARSLLSLPLGLPEPQTRGR